MKYYRIKLNFKYLSPTDDNVSEFFMYPYTCVIQILFSTMIILPSISIANITFMTLQVYLGNLQHEHGGDRRTDEPKLLKTF